MDTCDFYRTPCRCGAVLTRLMMADVERNRPKRDCHPPSGNLVAGHLSPSHRKNEVYFVWKQVLSAVCIERSEDMNEIHEAIQQVKTEILELKDMLEEQKLELSYLEEMRDYSTAKFTRDNIQRIKWDLDELYERK